MTTAEKKIERVKEIVNQIEIHIKMIPTHPEMSCIIIHHLMAELRRVVYHKEIEFPSGGVVIKNTIQ